MITVKHYAFLSYFTCVHLSTVSTYLTGNMLSATQSYTGV